MLDKENLLSHLKREEEKMLGSYILDQIELVLKRESEQYTDFLNPHERKIGKDLIKQISGVNFRQDGGYNQAERQRITLFPDYLFPDHVKPPISILKITGNFSFCSVNHRDFLGALMGLGIKRNKLGDILVNDEYAQIIVANEIKDFIELKLNRVNEVPVETIEISQEELVVPTQHTKEIKATVPSMRLDAVASAGFGDSRNKISSSIKKEQVKLNWRPETDPAQDVNIGDMISIRGRGRVKVVEDKGISNRGRIKLLLERYT